MSDGGVTRREAIKRALKAGAYAAPMVVVTAVPVGVAAVTPALAADISLSAGIARGMNNLAFLLVTATNLGPNDATGIAISDPVPANFAFLLADTMQGTYDRNTGVWTVGSLAVGAVARLMFIGNFTGPGTNRATRIASSPPDPNATNDAVSQIFP